MTEHGICAKCKKSVGCPYADDRITGCKNFVLEPELKLTSKEWLRQCNTEQLAEELLAWWFDGANTYSQFGLFKWEIDEAKDKITKWLKEKHDAK